MTTLPLAVVVPAQDCASTLPRALASISAQNTYRPAGVIVVDDGSRDGTAELARALGARVLSHEVSLGRAAALNAGFASADAQWLMQLDAQDEWLPNCLATLWPLREDRVLISGASVGWDRDGTARYHGPTSSHTRVIRSPADLAFPENFVPSSAVMLRASCFRAAGGYRTDVGTAFELELWLRMLELGHGAATPTPIARDGPRRLTDAKRRDVAAAHARVLALSVDRAWWRASSARRWSALGHWNGLHASMNDSDRRAAAIHARALVSDPARLLGLEVLLRERLRRRRWSSQLQL